MTELRIRHPVRTLERQVLLPAGTTVSPEVIHGLISSRPRASYRPLPVLSYKTVEKDSLFFMGAEPYRRIFEGAETISRILRVMREVRLVSPVLESLDYFKGHDPYTYRHVLIVFALSSLLASDLVEDYGDMIREAMAGPAHDFGKVSVPLGLLRKTGPLSRTERGLLEHHAAAGYVLLCYYQGEIYSFAAKVAKEHHERRDRSGYPLGIPLTDPMVEIIAACDIYDALLSPRPYRPTSYDNRTALEVLTEMAVEGKLDWAVVRALVSYNRKVRPHPSECQVSTEKRGVPPDGNLYGVIVEEDP
ncbi:MAG: HD-GYP domain-containing protein [Thermodesulfobacteriota bacterium]